MASSEGPVAADSAQAPERRHEGGSSSSGAAVGRARAGIAQALLDRLPHPTIEAPAPRAHGRGAGGGCASVQRHQLGHSPAKELLLEQAEGRAIARVGLEALPQHGAKPLAGRLGRTGRVGRHGPLARSRWATDPRYPSSQRRLPLIADFAPSAARLAAQGALR
jgi:hypothetical protein